MNDQRVEVDEFHYIGELTGSGIIGSLSNFLDELPNQDKDELHVAIHVQIWRTV